MHLPDGFVNFPLSAGAFVVSAGVAAVAVRRAGETLGERQAPLLGVTAAYVFAAQMLNFPIAAGTSGHFLGAVLAALLLGPLNGFLVMALVLVMQCLLFQDGGLSALGLNLFNMGVAGGLGGYAAFRTLRWVLPKTRAMTLLAAAVASWISIVLASSACALELAASGTMPLIVALPAMTGVHAVIGLGEALITAATLSLVMAARPDLLHEIQGRRPMESYA